MEFYQARLIVRDTGRSFATHFANISVKATWSVFILYYTCNIIAVYVALFVCIICTSLSVAT